MKQKKKVNPYEKKAPRKKVKLTRTHWILIVCGIAIAGFIAAYALIGSEALAHIGHNHAPGDGHTTTTTTSAVDHTGHTH